jgi:hypothetical protein
MPNFEEVALTQPRIDALIPAKLPCCYSVLNRYHHTGATGADAMMLALLELAEAVADLKKNAARLDSRPAP